MHVPVGDRYHRIYKKILSTLSNAMCSQMTATLYKQTEKRRA